MATRDYWDELWAAVPVDAQPPGLQRRWSFLRRELRAEASRARRAAAGEAPLRVLDLGCGDGRIAARLLGEPDVEVVAADVSEEALRRAGARRPDLERRLLDPGGAWELEDNSFDVVWAGEVIEHVLDTARWLSEVRRVLRPGGALLLTTPDHGPLLFARLALSRRAAAEHLHPLSDHVRFYTRRSLTGLLEEFHFDAQVRGVGGPPGARRSLQVVARR